MIITRSRFLLLIFVMVVVRNIIPCQFIYGQRSNAANIFPTPWNITIDSIGHKLSCFALDTNQITLAAERNTLVRILDNGNVIQRIYAFSELIQCIHVMKNGVIIISTDDDRWDASKPCSIYRSNNQGYAFKKIKSIEGGCAIWWSIASDREHNLFIGEYGPKKSDISKTVWKTSDFGENWEKIFQAPNLNGIHIHLVAVDPYTGFLYITYGDLPDSKATYCSENQGKTWTKIRAEQSTAVVFTKDNVYWGEDANVPGGTVTRYDKKTKKFSVVLKASDYGNYGGSIYQIALGNSGLIYVPMVKYREDSHLPTLWVGDGTNWFLLMSMETPLNNFGGFEHISHPDNENFIYVNGYRIKDGLVNNAKVSGSKFNRYVLRQNYPNPFNQETTISYFIEQATYVSLKIYNLQGNEIQKLESYNQKPGNHQVRFNADHLPGGTYFYRFETNDYSETKKMTIIK